MTTKALLAYASLAALILTIILVVFFGHDLSPTQVNLVLLFGAGLLAEVKSSSAYWFDGVAPKPPEDKP